MDAPITTCAMTHSTGIVTPIPNLPLLLPTSLTPWGHGLELVLLQQLSIHGMGNTAQEESQATPKTFNPTIHPTIPRLSSSFRLFLRFRQWLWFFKLLEPSPSSDEDEWVGQSSNAHYTIGLVSDCPTLTVHTGKRFKALISSGGAISLAHTSVYNMIEDHYKTKILPTAVNIKTVGRSSMSSLGKTTLHLCTANFKILTYFHYMWQAARNWYLFCIDIQKRYSLSYGWGSGKQIFIQREASFFTYTRNCEQQHNIAVVKSTLEILPRHNGIIPVMIKGHNLKAHVGYFISDQHANKGSWTKHPSVWWNL